MIRDPASQRQVDAADPARSTWLSANAGSGKTRVLTDRVARLLLEGVDPQNILCLTYTKAAASEMQNRLFKRLGDWAMMDQTRLRQQLRDLGAEGDLSGGRLRQARTLFAQAMETPGGLKIQTIHSFCAGLLRRFPLEAGVSPQFTEMEDRAAELLRTEVVDQIAMGSQASAIENLARHFTGDDFDALLQEIAGERAAFQTMPSDTELRDAFEISPGLSAQRLLEEVLPPATLTLIADTITLCTKGSTNDQKAAEKLSNVNLIDPTLVDIAILEDVFLTGDSAKAPFTAKVGTFPTKAVRAQAPDLVAPLDDLMVLIEEARGDRLALMAFERTRALYRFGTVFVQHYEAAKLRRGMLDFDDLIGKARQLLTDPAVAQWVLFRLDGGIDHILVDEAQDTSPDQWAVIESLAQEFATGQGARPGLERTIFVVGDKKQSIYSFQGADPEAFDRMQAHFDAELGRIGKKLNPLTLDYSFRSSTAILRVVDLVFQGPHSDGLGTDKPYHVAFKELMPGRVDLWPPVPKLDGDPEDRHWTDPVDQISERHHAVILAEQIADRIAEMVKSGTIPAETDDKGVFAQRPISEGDILVLVQRRSDLFAEIIRALKARKLRVAGADRLRVGAEMAVRDIGALLRFLALPEDDLSLAAVLKSPLFNWTEQQLFTLAHHRPNHTYLWAALRDGTYPETWSILQDLLNQADFLRPYDLINRLLTRHDGRRKLLARLGGEAEDGIDALLAQALAFESTSIPDLTGFIEWMETDDLQIKRQMDASGDRIRVMTVHGAKGLESPIVILPDTAKRPVRMTDAIYPGPDHVLWATTLAQMPPAMRAIRDARIAAQERERRRLLYVAMTRAESWLIVCAAGDTGTSGDSWHSMVAEGMEHVGAVAHDFGGESGLRYSVLDWTTLPLIDQPGPDTIAINAPHFAVLPPQGASGGPITPSALGGSKVLGDELAEGDTEVAMARGSVLHLLLEHLPAIQPETRAGYAAQLLTLAPDLAIAGDPGPLIADAIRILENPALADLFAGNTLAEIDLTATLPGWANRLHGTIDRLILTPETVTAIDFKTNRKVPQTPEETPEGILRQMGAYHAMLHQIYPDRAINVAILWTATAQLMPLSPALVMAALQRVTVP